MTDVEPPEDEDDSREPVPVGGGAAASAEEYSLPGGLSPWDEKAFSDFYRTYLPRLTAYLVYQGASVHIASELVQDTMIKAYRKWNHLTWHRSWAYKVAYQAFVRHATRVEEEPVEEVPEPTAVLGHPGEADAWVGEQEIVRVLGMLPARQRQVLALTLDGWAPAEIAELLGVEGAAVRSSLLKARRALAEYLRMGREEE
ncbi:RNA polymerase, sigma-24 subunit, RpoE, ECF subfamily [Actinobacteria bacterium OK074]|nr:RNA polymerase, sigma-24 subunit, RpoE, ECF subfamily [Actinobacteria bacterium OK074]